MLTITPLNGGGKTAQGFDRLAYLKATEYYKASGQDMNPTSWGGQGAAALGLKGIVKDADLDRLANGFDPMTGNPLRQNAGEPAQRMGYDCTFSAPKGVSLAYAAASEGEKALILAAVQSAVDDALAYQEAESEARRGKRGVIREKGNGFIVAKFQHFSARENRDQAGTHDLPQHDPQLHIHALVFSQVHRQDGTWGAFDQASLMEQQKATGALFRASLASRMQDLGYGITKRIEYDDEFKATGNVFFGLTGLTQATEREFSNRAKAVEAAQAQGMSHEQAKLWTRAGKDEPPHDELMAAWQHRFNALDINDPQQFAQSLKGRENHTATIGDPDLLEKMHEQESVFQRSKLVERIALENVGRLNAQECVQEADNFIQRGLEAGHLKTYKQGPKTVYAAAWMHDLEQDIQDRARSRVNDQIVKLTPEVVQQSMTDFEAKRQVKLNREQREAIEFVTTGTGGTAIIRGFAGTGKTFTSLAIKDAYEQSGKTVHGVSVAWKAAKKLEEETGVASQSGAAFIEALKNDKIKLDKDSVVVIDEAGMMGSRMFHTIQSRVDEAGGKLILMGDPFQLNPVDAGSGMLLAIDGAGSAALSGIRRQKDDQDKITSSMFYGLPPEDIARALELDQALKHAASDDQKTIQAELSGLEARRIEAAKSMNIQPDGKAILARLESRGQIHETNTKKEAVNDLVDDYFRSPTESKDKLVLAGTNAEVAELNKAIRQRRIDLQQIDQGQSFQTLQNGYFKEADFSVGDKIRFGKKDTKLGIVNNDEGTIQSLYIDTKGNWKMGVTMDSEDPSKPGRTVEFNPAKVNSFSHAYASTVHKAQGQGKSEVFTLMNPGMTDLHSSLVAFTRTKDQFRLYATKDDLHGLNARLDNEQAQPVEAFKAMAKRVELQRLKTTTAHLAQGQAHDGMTASRQPVPIQEAMTANTVNAFRQRLQAKRQARMEQEQPKPQQPKPKQRPSLSL